MLALVSSTRAIIVGACFICLLAVQSVAAQGREAFVELLAKAKAGHAEAQFQVGQHYAYNANRGLVDPTQAALWFGKAAEQNHLGAIISLSALLASDQELRIDYTDVTKWLSRAADLGHIPSSVRLGQLLWTGAKGLRADRPAAYRRLREAALLGNEGAALTIVHHALAGDGVVRDAATARAILQWLAAHGSVVAEMHLAAWDGSARKLESLGRLTKRFQKQAAKNSDPRLLTLLGHAFESGAAYDNSSTGEAIMERFSRAREYYEHAVKAGDAEAQARLGALCRKGWGGPADPERAHELFENSSASGHPLGQLNLALALLDQPSATTQMPRIMELLESAGRTNPGAAFLQGMLLYEGKHVARDVARAAKHFERAAKSGHVRAYVNLGVIAANGELGPVNLAEAATWWTQAALAGSNEGASFLARISERLSPDDRQLLTSQLQARQPATIEENAVGWVDLTLLK